ncbi:hypothetical protein [Candidatus Vidania fulgoroideorum]
MKFLKYKNELIKKYIAGLVLNKNLILRLKKGIINFEKIFIFKNELFISFLKKNIKVLLNKFEIREIVNRPKRANIYLGKILKINSFIKIEILIMKKIHNFNLFL